MQPRTIGFVDAGFLRRTAAAALGCTHRDTTIDAAEVVQWARNCWPGTPFLRTYWYDGALDPGSPAYKAQRRQFNLIADTAGVQLRLGHMVRREEAWHRAVKHAVRACGVTLEEFCRHFTFAVGYQQKGVDTLLVLDLVRFAQQGICDTAIVLAGELRRLADSVVSIDRTSLARMVRQPAVPDPGTGVPSG